MYLLRRAGPDTQTTVCTTSPDHALAQVRKLTFDGITPVVTDLAGRRMTVADLMRHAEVPQRDARPQTLR